MRVFDTSSYYKDHAIDNYIIEVLAVNKERWVTFDVSKGFSLALNSSNLRYNKATEESKLICIPDGIYEIKQSVKPNALTVSHFYHLRTVEITNSLLKEMSKLISEKCDLTKSEYIVNRDKLRDIEEYVKAAKWMVEECNQKKEGKELYEFAQKLLEQYSHECQC